MENIISFIRRQKNIKQADLARELDVSPSYLCKVEKGVQEPSEKFMRICSEFLNVAVGVLFPEKLDKKKMGDSGAKNMLWIVRTEKGIKQNHLAKIIGCSPSYLSKVEKGLQEPNEQFKKKCAKILKVKEAKLFPGYN